MEPLIEATASKSTREVERLIAAAFPQPDLPAQVRVLPQKRDIEQAQFEDGHDDSLFANPSRDSPGETVSAVGRQSDSPQSSPSPAATRRSVIAPLAPSRYLLKVTLSEETHARLEQARSRCPVR